jgi:hypothetical protein
MSYSCYLGGVEWPTPAKLTVKIKGKNKTLTLLNEGEINFLRTPGLSEIVLPVTLSMLTGSRSPSYYMGVLERLKTSKGTTQFILVRRSPDGRRLFDTNMTVSVEDYNITEDAKEGLDVSVDINLKQWRSYYEKLDSKANAKAMADALLDLYNTKTRTLKLQDVLGDIRVRAGTLLVVMLGLGDINVSNYLMAEQVKHTFNDGQHLMELKMRGGTFVA